MNFYYNGTDIYNDVSVNYCVHEMFAEKQADTLVIRFNDTMEYGANGNRQPVTQCASKKVQAIPEKCSFTP